MELEKNFTEILVCADDDNLSTINQGAMIQEM
jgi:hypothetical protein